MRTILNNRWLVNLRGRIEQEIRKILRDNYRLEVDAGTPLRYYLDFKNDRKLLELRETLDRIENGKFGVCLLCGDPIDEQLLNDAPGSQFCSTCTGGLQAPSHVSSEEAETQVIPSR